MRWHTWGSLPPDHDMILWSNFCHNLFLSMYASGRNYRTSISLDHIWYHVLKWFSASTRPLLHKLVFGWSGDHMDTLWDERNEYDMILLSYFRIVIYSLVCMQSNKIKILASTSHQCHSNVGHASPWHAWINISSRLTMLIDMYVSHNTHIHI